MMIIFFRRAAAWEILPADGSVPALRTKMNHPTPQKPIKCPADFSLHRRQLSDDADGAVSSGNGSVWVAANLSAWLRSLLSSLRP